jgi:hypothetical protein
MGSAAKEKRWSLKTNVRMRGISLKVEEKETEGETEIETLRGWERE